MDITQVEINELKPHKKNPKKHSKQQVQHIAASISQFGFTQPIVVDENNIILIGHGRLAAAKELELETVPVKQITGLTEAQKEALLVIDNSLASETGFDAAAVEAVVARLTSEGFDLAALGLGKNTVGEQERGEGKTSDPVKAAKEAYDSAEQKAVSFYFYGKDLEDFNERLEKAQKLLGAQNKAHALLGMLDWYENRDS